MATTEELIRERAAALHALLSEAEDYAPTVQTLILDQMRRELLLLADLGSDDCCQVTYREELERVRAKMEEHRVRREVAEHELRSLREAWRKCAQVLWSATGGSIVGPSRYYDRPDVEYVTRALESLSTAFVKRAVILDIKQRLRDAVARAEKRIGL